MFFPDAIGSLTKFPFEMHRKQNQKQTKIMYDRSFVYLQKFPLRCTESRIKSRIRSNVNTIHEQKLLMTGI